MSLPLLNDLKFYVVMNDQGKFFRAKGRNGYGDTWSDELAKIRVYTRIGPARAVVSYFFNRSTQYPAPKLIEINVGKVEIVDESERLEKNKKKKMLADARYAERRKQERLEHAKEMLKKAQEAVKKLTR